MTGLKLLYSSFMTTRWLQLLFLIVIVTHTFSVGAQEQEDKNKIGSVFGLHTGPLLPNQVPGMTEIMPVWGVKYGAPVRKGLIEFGVANSRSVGVIYYNGSISMRGDFNLDDMFAVTYAGLDIHYYSPAGSTFNSYFGGHVGGGFAAHLGDLLWFRTDMKFNLNPGTALYIGFGLEWRAPAGDTQELAN